MLMQFYPADTEYTNQASYLVNYDFVKTIGSNYRVQETIINRDDKINKI